MRKIFRTPSFSLWTAVPALAVSLAACGDDDAANGPNGGTGNGSGNLNVPDTYAFQSRFAAGESSVAYDGQVARQVMIEELIGRLDGLTEELDTGARVPAEDEIADELLFYYEFDDAVGGDVAIELSTTPPLLQSTFADLGSGRNLVGKIAGNDPVGQHVDWSTSFRGWGDQGSTNPDALVRSWIDELDTLAQERANNNPQLGPDGSPTEAFFVTADGRDLQQLIEKFLRVAIAFSQGADDYLDDDTEGKGILTANTQDDDAPYTVLEHQWDEGFGYFGAARDYLDYTDEEIAGAGGRAGWENGYHDTDGDGAIDLASEYNFGHSTNAAKRDRGSSSEAPTDYTQQAIDGFLRGRAIIAAAGDPLTDDEFADLQAARDQAVDAWERAIASTAVHYINDTLQDMGKFGSDDYDFETHAKHWSELEGFALGLQFNPRSPVTAEQFEELHDLIGTSPVLPNEGQARIDEYRQALLDARALLGSAYDFAPENLGNDDGTGGW